MADTKVAAIIFYVIIGIGGGNMPGNPLAFWWGRLAAVTDGSKKRKNRENHRLCSEQNRWSENFVSSDY